MRNMTRMTAGVMLAGMTGCTLVPPPPPPQPLLVAYPAPGKPPEVFQQDDAYCKNVSAAPLAPQTQTTPQPAPPPADPAMPLLTPGQVFLRCMAARGNTIQPLAQTAPPVYGYYAPYPIYAGYGGYYPWLYGGYFGFGYGGYRYGFHDDYFRGGFREGGGFRGGGGGFRR